MQDMLVIEAAGRQVHLFVQARKFTTKYQIHGMDMCYSNRHSIQAFMKNQTEAPLSMPCESGFTMHSYIR